MHWVRLTLLAAAIGLGGAAAWAMGQGRISDAEWFAGAEHKILVLEYDSPAAAAWGRPISELIGRLSLAGVTGLTNYAVITLRQEEPRTELTIPAVEALARRQKTPVVIWGEVYENSGRLFLTSHLRYVRLDPQLPHPLHLSWDASRLGVPGVDRVEAQLQTSQVNFAPAEISRASLESLLQEWRRTAILRELPNEQAPPSGELKPDAACYVTATDGPWTRLKVRNGGEGWVQLAGLSHLEEFRQLSGVVLYAHGFLQYLAGSYPAAVTSFDKYLGDYSGREDPLNRAFAHLLLGYAHFSQLAAGPARLAPALEHFEQASVLQPNVAAPANCVALVRFAEAGRTHVPADVMRGLEKMLVHVIQTENDLTAVRNLQVLYRLPGADGYFGGDTAAGRAREDRLSVLRRLEAQFAASPAAGGSP